MRHRVSGSRRRLIAATGTIVLLVAGGCANPSPKTGTLAHLPATSSPLASQVPTSSPVGQPSPSPATATRAPVYPVVDSCDPGSVPGATPVRAAIVGASALILHLPILEYHRIVPLAEAGNSLHALVVPPDAFSAQLDGLNAAGWQTITTATLADDLEAGVKPPPKTFAITIDDGWEDGYTYALPVLAAHAFVATYFVIPGRIDQPGFLTSAELRALASAGDEIGDHTMSHFNLAGGSAATRQYQIDAAAARIAQITGHWPESLAYPFGGENAQSVAAVAACRELRIALIEGPVPPQKPGASGTPDAGRKPSASPTPRPTEMPVPNETWANRFTIPRIRVGPGTTSAELLGEFDRYLRAA